ncbi:hypothetical protein [Coleofasciculus sp.]|uniref:hypothetical protein n=1 Tax=Coleofasciculus sp. TaxID=3100458 RepID=UPI0039F8AB6E
MMAFQIPSPHFPTPDEASIDVEIVEGEGDEQTATPTDETPQVEDGTGLVTKPLRDIIPETPEDEKSGFKRLRDWEYELYRVPLDRSLYLTREKASKNLFKISASRLGQHLKELQNFIDPEGYYIDEQGLTPEAIAELRIKLRYTSRLTFPNPDWSQYQRGDLKKLGIENPDYSLRFQYWDEYASRSRSYHHWLETHSSLDDKRVYQGEIYDWGESNREERESDLRSDIELAHRDIFSSVDSYLDLLRDKLKSHARERGLEIRREIDEELAAIITNPEDDTDNELEEL